jgi:ketosteroid isomerase-like protein
MLVLAAASGCCEKESFNAEVERAAIEKTVKDGIGWALTKDLDLLHSVIAQDSNLVIVNPDSSVIRGFDEFRKNEAFWMDPRFKATRFEVRKLKITISRSGTVAWFSCYLDDLCEWDGRPAGWVNVRWTGVVEKRDGRWITVQMHFSFPTKD